MYHKMLIYLKSITTEMGNTYGISHRDHAGTYAYLQWYGTIHRMFMVGHCYRPALPNLHTLKKLILLFAELIISRRKKL